MIYENTLEPKISSNLDTNFLKIVAAITMLIDHIGYVFFPDMIVLRIIGRISFPLFAYCIVVGFLYTSNIIKYAIRLGIFSVLSQPFYVLAFDLSWYELNIFPTLLMGLLIIHFLKEKKWFIVTILLILVSLGDFSYGLQGILLMVLFYIFRNQRELSAIVTGIFLSIPLLSNHIQGFAVFSIPLIYGHTKLNIKMNKYVFYIFYPMHLLGIYFTKLILFK
ncbi:TraX family protein [Defluviitalea saccharophila]|uniref:TraX family protein n=1 Tax=Defluviitalea saccharophila TaxID=879970 RepID=A0ABZ2Y7H3_9FIRM|nr:fimbrial assembly protein [Candidatus Epulonipiscium sp.]